MPEATFDKILQTVVYLKDKIDSEMVTKDEITVYRHEILSHIDGIEKETKNN